MKIVKRDGRTVDYDREKIRIAIGKANNEVSLENKINDEDIEDIIRYIEALDKKRMLVEDIQDIIEEKLMEKGKFPLAKIYIIYRYKRSIIRKSNTIDASILALLKNGNYSEGNYLDANRQRDIMAGEVSKDLAYRLLLPKNVVEAETNNRLKMFGIEYFTEPIIENAKIDIEEMFTHGTVINGIKIEEPKSFQSACNVLVEVVAAVASNQTGNIFVDAKSLFKYYHMSFEKKYSTYKTLMKTSLSNDEIRALAQTQAFLEVKSGIQTIYYQINTITIGSGLVPPVYFIIDPKYITSIEEEKLIYEFIRQKSLGIVDEKGDMVVPKYPEIVYSLPRGDQKYRLDYITKELVATGSSFWLMNSKRFDKFEKEICLFNQGSIVLNLVRLALDCEDKSQFISLLDETLSIAFEGFSCRNHNLQGIYSDKSPIHWRHGAIARLDSGERIDQYLKKGHSLMTLAVIGYESAMRILGDEDGSIKKKTKEVICEYIKTWNKECSYEIALSNYYDEQVVAKIKQYDAEDIERYGNLDYYDSLEFMETDYFKEGTIYSFLDDESFVNEELAENKNYIFKKRSHLI